ncbi:response regulator transcription factor [Bacillus sp. N1-1]|jgi:two-component system, OmpR family, alkaline phosphatase synthesis response regulator PhoP|uniref:response regulator transcription factor n=1 Tax=Bacillus sp. N1-1 TaxID=2682541 RepID=UPI001318D5C2|nr:response regulator transcription factor [Bacillus sp. N1-1]QHA92845.1 response regulator [Bacillus sp. N1-1]
MAQKILVVDDEMSILTLLQFNLEQAGYDVVTAEDGAEALKVVEAEKPNCIILDLMLPEMDGLEVCKELRQRHIHTPVLMLTAKDDEFDKVLGLELGADDYMTKPFSPREVVARVKAILRRVKQLEESKVATQMEESEKIQVGELEVYPNNYESFFQGEMMEVTPKEFELLVYLVRHKGRVLTREQLLSAVWNYDFVGDTRIVDVHVSHLREKIEQNTRKPEYIKTIRGLGYKLEEPSVK